MTVTLQELITRGRFIMSDAPSRLRVFAAVDGRRTVKDIARSLERHENNVRRDLTTLADAGLIQVCTDSTRLPVYEKVPLARTIPMRYFEPVGKRPQNVQPIKEGRASTRRSKGPFALPVPSEAEILEIAKQGEDQLYEFKAPGTEASKLTKEIAAMLNTSRGGIILYGVEDDGTIAGTDISRQKLDQPLQNSVKNGVSPAASIRLVGVKVLGTEILAIIVPPWNRHDVYQFQEKFYIRKGTNVFAMKPEELKLLYRGQPIL